MCLLFDVEVARCSSVVCCRFCCVFVCRFTFGVCVHVNVCLLLVVACCWSVVCLRFVCLFVCRPLLVARCLRCVVYCLQFVLFVLLIDVLSVI